MKAPQDIHNHSFRLPGLDQRTSPAIAIAEVAALFKIESADRYGCRNRRQIAAFLVGRAFEVAAFLRFHSQRFRDAKTGKEL